MMIYPKDLFTMIVIHVSFNLTFSCLVLQGMLSFHFFWSTEFDHDHIKLDFERHLDNAFQFLLRLFEKVNGRVF